jgi:cytochrome c-type biogenesis protein CcmE
MDGRRIKFIVIGLGIAATMAFMLVVATQKSDGGFAYYVTVKEYTEKGQPKGRFRVNGKVAPGTIQRLPGGRQVTFTITDKDGSGALPVDFAGIIPDTFVDDADVVVEGDRRPDGVFAATTLLAKCPSKYEAADGRQQVAQGAK